MTIIGPVRADGLHVGDETLDPVSGCTCVVISVSRTPGFCALMMRGSEGDFQINVPAGREMSLRKKNDPFAG